MADGEALQGLHNRGGRGIGNGLVLERFIFARQASNFAVTLHVVQLAIEAVKPLVHFAAAVLLGLHKAAFHSGTGIFSLQGFKLNLGVDEAGGFADITLDTANFAQYGSKLRFNLTAAIAHGVAHVARGIVGAVTLVAHGRDDFGNERTQLGVELEEALSARSLSGGNAVMQTNDTLAVVGANQTFSTGLVAIVAPTTVVEHEEEQQDNEQAHAVAPTALAVAISLLLAERENAGKVHTLVVLHEGHKARDVIHIRLLFSDVKVNGGIAFVSVRFTVLLHHVVNRRTNAGFHTRQVLKYTHLLFG